MRRSKAPAWARALAAQLRHWAIQVEEMGAENSALHGLVEAMKRSVCRCGAVDGEGYRAIRAQCPVHGAGQFQALQDEAEDRRPTDKEVGARRGRLREAGLIPHTGRRICNCRHHGHHPVERPYPDCAKHGVGR